MTIVKNRTRRGRSFVKTKTAAAGAGVFGLFGGAGCLLMILVACFNIAWISCLIAGVYFLLTGNWIGDAAFLN